ncbi:hypothetical protein PSPO01_15555 [Paraphaeosphaeria sporulosa]
MRKLDEITPDDLHIDSNRRIPCAGHIINPLSQALINSSGVSNFEAELTRASPEHQYAMFRARRAIGKLHNFVSAVSLQTPAAVSIDTKDATRRGQALQFFYAQYDE